MIRVLGMRRPLQWVALTLFAWSAQSSSVDESQALRAAVSVDLIRQHQQALQTIADNNGGTRVAGSEGYRASVDYVKARMVQAGYVVSLQEFSFYRSEDNSAPILTLLSTEQKRYVANVDFASMSGIGFGEIEAEVEAVDLQIPSQNPNHSTSGCERADFRDFKRGNIALIQRGSCTFQSKAENALAAGASGVIIFNEGNPGREGFIASRLNTSLGSLPVIGARFAVGDELRAGLLNGPSGHRVLLRVDVVAKEYFVHNVIAETPAGDDTRVVVVGAHLDSVQDGPGINDNGSGSANNLAIAEQIAKLTIVPKNKLRFIWFAAEEFGLLGSEHYVKALNDQQRQRILAMLNFDMLGSSNYARFVYDGDNSAKTELSAHSGPDGSGYLEHVFLDYFGAQNLVSHPTAFNGRSDYGPFIEQGIPAGGLFSGAEGLKPVSFVAIYGGTAGRAFDPCYHQACDDFRRTGETPETALALRSIDELSDAAAHAVLHVANSSREIRPPAQRVPVSFDFEWRGGLLIK